MSETLKITVIGAGSEQFAPEPNHDIVLDRVLWSNREAQVPFVGLRADALSYNDERHWPAGKRTKKKPLNIREYYGRTRCDQP